MIKLNNKYATANESKEMLYKELSKYIGKDDYINKEIIVYNGWELKFIGVDVKEEPKGIMYYSYTFNNSQINGSIKIKVKDRYIKSKDKLIVKSIEDIEIY